MSVWAIADLHLAFSVPEKSMVAFGPVWENYAEKIAEHWKELIAPDDLVLIAGDLSWAMTLQEALIDLEWIGRLPGTKVAIRGNHDYWWGSLSKMAKVMPPSLHLIQNNCFNWHGISIGGSRLWDSSEYRFHSFIEYRENPRAKVKTPEDLQKAKEEEERIFTRELERLKLSLAQLDPQAHTRIAMTHYPPINSSLEPSRASALLEAHQVDLCVFGHLHNVRRGSLPFGSARGVRYALTSCDYLDFYPLKVL